MNDGAPTFDDDRTVVVLRAGVRCFGRYSLVRKLGQGGMGVVWLARDEKLERDVALKFLPEHVRQDPEAVRDLKREVRRCLELTHVNIVRVYDFAEDANAAAITMEYVPGQSLAARKAAKPNGCFDVEELAPLVTQLCAALEFAHTVAKVVHRDLKPANLLVTDAGVLKIADFGIARSLAETQTRLTRDLRATSATLAFAGPQQLAGENPTPADDIYSLGATLYDLITGKPPFFRGDVLRQIETAQPPPMHERRAQLDNTGAPIPRTWEETICACLTKRADDRPAHPQEISTRLNVVIVGTSAELTPVPEVDPDFTERIVKRPEKDGPFGESNAKRETDALAPPAPHSENDLARPKRRTRREHREKATLPSAISPEVLHSLVAAERQLEPRAEPGKEPTARSGSVGFAASIAPGNKNDPASPSVPPCPSGGWLEGFFLLSFRCWLTWAFVVDLPLFWPSGDAAIIAGLTFCPAALVLLGFKTRLFGIVFLSIQVVSSAYWTLSRGTFPEHFIDNIFEPPFFAITAPGWVCLGAGLLSAGALLRFGPGRISVDAIRARRAPM